MLDEERYSLKQVEGKLRLSKSTIYREIRDRKLGYVLLRGRKYVSHSQIEAYLLAGRKEARAW